MAKTVEALEKELKELQNKYDEQVKAGEDATKQINDLNTQLEAAKKSIEVSIPKEDLEKAIETAKQEVQKDIDANYVAKDSLAETHVEKADHDAVVVARDDLQKEVDDLKATNKTVELTEENEKLKAEVARLNAGKLEPSHVKILEFSGKKERVELCHENRTEWEFMGFVWRMPKSGEREFLVPVEILEKVKGKGILKKFK